jgi:ATP-dependent helicase HrpA
VREAQRKPRSCCNLTRDELMRHEAAGITTNAFPKTLRLGGVDCAATYLHEPGDPRDGLTVTVPIFALNQVNAERCEWLVPGMLKDKVLALLKSLPSARAAVPCAPAGIGRQAGRPDGLRPRPTAAVA